MALSTALPMQLFYRVFSLPIRALDRASAAVVRPFGIHADAGHASAYTQEELRHVIDMSRQGGHIEAEEQRLIQGVFEFADAEVREAMVPRTAVTAVPASATLAEVKAAFKEHGYTRLPVYRERLDDVVGVLFRRDLEDFVDGTRPAAEFDAVALAHPPLFMPSTAKLGAALEADARQPHAPRLRHRRARRDWKASSRWKTYSKRSSARSTTSTTRRRSRRSSRSRTAPTCSTGCWPCATPTATSTLDLPEEGHYTTVAGFLLARAGRLLKPGDTVEHEGATFRVERVERRRLRGVRFTPAPPEAKAGTAAQAALESLVPFVTTAAITGAGLGVF